MLIDIFKTRQRELCICLLLGILILAAYGQIVNHDFISFDDERLVTANRHVRNGFTWDSFIWSFTAGIKVSNYWIPLTWLSHILDCELYGLNPMGHHWTNLLLHMANTILLFSVFKKMTGALWPSAFMAGLFAIHPLHVESVAWVSERKGVLSAFFWLLAMLTYVYYAERPGWKRYFLVMLGFVLGLMSKPVVVTLPFVLLLIDYWPLGRWPGSPASRQCSDTIRQWSVARLVGEKVPFLGLAAGAGVVTFIFQQKGGALAPLGLEHMKIHVANALISYLKYIGKMVWPSHLAVFYPHPGMPSVGLPVLAGALLLGISVVLLRMKRRHPYLLVGWLWYLGTLVPMIGLVQVGAVAMTDRYAYIPFIGLFMMVAWGGSELAGRWRYSKLILAVSAGAVLVILLVVTWIQVSHWQNSMKLFRHALAVTHNNWLAHNSLGVALLRADKLDEAGFHFNKTLQIKPDDVMAYNNLGSVLARKGELDEAIFYFQKAIAIKPDYVKALDSLGKALFDRQSYQEAGFYYRKALKVKPDYASAHYNLGNLLVKQGKRKEADIHYTKAININPEYTKFIIQGDYSFSEVER